MHCPRCVVVASLQGGRVKGEGMSGEGKGDGEGEDEGASSSSSFGVICREKAGVRVMARASRCHREGEGAVEGASSSGRG